MSGSVHGRLGVGPNSVLRVRTSSRYIAVGGTRDGYIFYGALSGLVTFNKGCMYESYIRGLGN